MRAAIVVQLALIVPVGGQHCYTIVSVCTHFNTATHGVELMLMVLLLPVWVPWASWCGVVAADVVAQNTHYVQRLVMGDTYMLYTLPCSNVQSCYTLYTIRRWPMVWTHFGCQPVFV